MDRITKSLLDEFAAEHGVARMPEDKQFEHFAAYLTISRHHGDAFETSDVATGAGADTGIDAVAIVINGTLVTDAEMVEELAKTNGFLEVTFVFVQAERSSSFESAKIGQFGFGVVDFFADQPRLPRNTTVEAASEVMAKVYASVSRFKRGNPACRLYYVTTGKWTEDRNLEVRRKAVVDDLINLRIFRDVEFIPVDADRIQKLYNQMRNAISREFTFADKTVVPELPGIKEAYLGIIPAKEFIPLIEDDGGEMLRSIFYDNVRDWQDYNAVNDGIRATLQSAAARSRFVLMNNGITIITKKLLPTGNKFTIEDYQIVNGCQTSHVLWKNREFIDDSVMIPLRLIATEDEEVIGAIIKATNQQTEVKQEQLLAFSDFQKKLEAYFLSFELGRRLYYERRSRQFANVNVEKTRIVTPASLIRAYASMFLDEPHRTTRNYKTLLDKIGDSIFGSDHRLHAYYAAAVAHYRLEYLFRNQFLDAKYKPARYHILLALRIMAVPQKPAKPNSHEMDRYADKLLTILWDTTAAETAFRGAAEVVDQVANGNFHRDHIRTQPFTDSLKKELVTTL